jgi:hypothetical protein
MPRATLSAGKDIRYSLSKWMGGLHNRYGRFEEEKTLLPLPGIESRLFDFHPIA